VTPRDEGVAESSMISMSCPQAREDRAARDAIAQDLRSRKRHDLQILQTCPQEVVDDSKGCC